MKICYICGEYPPGPQGGIGTILHLAAKRLVEKGHRVRVIGVYNDDRYPEDHFWADGVEVYRIRETGKGAVSFFKACYQQYKQIRKWVEDGEVDIIEAPESRGWFAFWPRMSVPCVLRAHGSETQERLYRGLRPNSFTRYLEEQSYSRADGYTAISKYSADAARSVFKLKHPIEVIYYGIEFIDVPQRQRKSNTIAFAGTVNEKKGVITLISAAKELLEAKEDFVIDIYGKDGMYNGASMMAYLKGMMRGEMLDKINFKGPVTREVLFDAYSKCTMAVFPSQWETFGLTPIEAMMCGCPVIHTTIPTGYELIDNGNDGLLVDPHDAHELAQKMMLLLHDGPLRRKLGENGILKVKNTFPLDLMCDKLLTFYGNTIHNFEKE